VNRGHIIPRSHPPKVYDAYVGRYEIGHESIVTFTREGDRLMAQSTNEGKFEVFPESDAVFFINPVADATITFVKDDKGKVAHIVLRHEGRETKTKRLDGEP
jgi:hypothetical protein